MIGQGHVVSSGDLQINVFTHLIDIDRRGVMYINVGILVITRPELSPAIDAVSSLDPQVDSFFRRTIWS